MKTFFLKLWYQLTGRYYKTWWALESCKQFLLGNGGEQRLICKAIDQVFLADYDAKWEAVTLVMEHIQPHGFLIYHLQEIGWYPAGHEMDPETMGRAAFLETPLYRGLRDRWLNDLIIDLKRMNI